MRRVLVVGGAGYIGAHMAKRLHRAGIEPVVLDNLTAGRRDAVRYGRLVEGDLGDREILDRVLAERVDAVVHFADYSRVGESMRHPAEYYRNNVVCTQNLLDAMLRRRVSSLVYSSSAAVYGDPEYVPVDELHPLRPLSPYGRTKLMSEQILADYGRAYGLKATSLRYFNAAGADPDGELGECHEPETHLIPLALQAASGRSPSVTVYGADYDTPDGTCVRDYIHVQDLCDAHLLALQELWNGGTGTVYNLGNSRGFSVHEVIAAVQEVTGASLAVHYGERRPGDPARLVADASRAQRTLGWTPRHGDLKTMVAHAWRWEKSCYSRT